MTMNRRSDKLGRSTHPEGGLHDLSQERTDNCASTQADSPQPRLRSGAGSGFGWYRGRRVQMEAARRSPRPRRSLPAPGQSLAVRSRTVVGLAAERLAGLAAHCLPQLSRAAVSRELGSRLQRPRLWLLLPHSPRPQGRFRACPLGFIHIDTVAPALGGPWWYLFVTIIRATHLMTMPVASKRDMISAVTPRGWDRELVTVSNAG